jgi:hypothetical protein
VVQALYCATPVAPKPPLNPHSVPFARYYTNPTGIDAVRRGNVPVPVGTTILKVKQWSETAGPAWPHPSYAAMIKREPGYDPADADWEYVYTYRADDPAGAWKTERGKLDACIDCHRNAKATDYLFRTYLKK